MTGEIDFRSHLPPYRSLLTPNAKYDYKTHSLIPINQNELTKLINSNKNKNDKNKNDNNKKIKMKYKSLLSDVSRRTLSIRINNVNNIQNQLKNLTNYYQNRKIQFRFLPIEILELIFYYINDFESYKMCLFVNKQFYQLSKSFFYSEISFSSTYRFSQFISYLRLNKDIGLMVKKIDLSGIKPCNYLLNEDDDEISTLEESESNGKILAGWRDWKFLKNPLYTINSLSKIQSNGEISSSSKTYKSLHSYSSNKINHRLTNFLKSKRRKKNNSINSNLKVKPSNYLIDLSNSSNLSSYRPSIHPKINKFLYNYQTSKDLPIGYILHLINLCPNITKLNLGNLSLSIDYEINKSMIFKYQNFDIINNYPKNLLNQINNIMYDNNELLTRKEVDSSCNSSIFSINSFSKPIRKYNSLLPPINSNELSSYLKKGDGKIYLSDLNLKSINNNYLSIINEDELLNHIIKNYSNNLTYLNLSSILWLNKKLIKNFVQNFLLDHLNSLIEEFKDDDDDDDDDLNSDPIDLIMDFTDSGMYKNLRWAKLIDLNVKSDRRLIYKIINDQLLESFEETIQNDRLRRGRIGQNYLS
ncbi:hypothetical protein HYPBUDRAFT_7319 [Hyphopichia burtonii NRRL Y-1933]|uniref:F-box domain-containing protein n=1 Tax=Hyphopichia burtonii NRRL Y-1933 TaxID=984485 RepID=A0A1E4RFH2_9ASCO|nr:hypothetical protein HYPBUDRAFT_7319 [Hyphopichia burtonii NRRL Y-1933]ODV65993.1 hypothetical protein HYPBUDRAFT_7319 [Hyphopichia burtonii NRRL Y-1933]